MGDGDTGLPERQEQVGGWCWVVRAGRRRGQGAGGRASACGSPSRRMRRLPGREAAVGGRSTVAAAPCAIHCKKHQEITERQPLCKPSPQRSGRTAQPF
ncbi:hypothetical protein GCM10009663_27910 [Kitasatospora arboriphila]|uniref:Uncharacterized protein n=1 Tax=Kitasatospora arboriphila TaxID=258052 RepID=A0ABP4E0T0_9ACTN